MDNTKPLRGVDEQSSAYNQLREAVAEFAATLRQNDWQYLALDLEDILAQFPAQPADHPTRRAFSDETLQAIHDMRTGQGGECGQYIAGWQAAVAYIAANVKAPEQPAVSAPVGDGWPNLSWSTIEAFRPILTDLAIATPESNEEYAFRFEEYLRDATQELLAARRAPPESASPADPQPVAWTVIGPDGENSVGDGWFPISAAPEMHKYLRIREGHSIAYAYAAPTVAVPNGWVIVPREPTPEMLNHAMGWNDDSARSNYTAMLAAAPPAAVVSQSVAGGESGDVNERMLAALNAALGIGGDFPLRKDGDPAFWWRPWLEKMAGLKYDGERFVVAGQQKGNGNG